MIITISGKPGSGKSLVANMLAEKLNYGHIYIGQIRRDMAKKRGISIEEYNKIGETDFSTDKEVDEYVKIQGKKDNMVIESRTAFFLIPKSLKICLDVDIKEGAKRIFLDLQKNKLRNEDYPSYEATVEGVNRRIASDSLRYKKYYNIDMLAMSNYDLVIDTTMLTPEQVLDKILNFINKRINLTENG